MYLVNPSSYLLQPRERFPAIGELTTRNKAIPWDYQGELTQGSPEGTRL